MLARATDDGEVRLEQRLARHDARGEGGAAVAAVGVPVLDRHTAVRTLGSPRGRVGGRVAREDGERELRHLLLLRFGHGEGVELHEGLRALAVELGVEGGQRDEAVDLLSLQHALILAQPQRRAHRVLREARVELPLGEQQEVIGLRASPCRVEPLVAAGGLILLDERVERLRRGLRATLGRLGAEHLLAHPLDLECREHEELLRAQRVRARGANLGAEIGEQARRVGVLVGLPVELDRVHLLAGGEQVRGILREHLLDVGRVVRLGKPHGALPLVLRHAAVDGGGHIARPQVGCDRLGRHADERELGADLAEQRRALGQHVDQLLEGHVVLHLVVAGHERLHVLRLRVVLRRLARLLPLLEKVADVVPRGGELLVVARTSLHELDHLEPVAQVLAQLQCQVLPVEVAVDLLRLVEVVEVGGHLRRLLLAVVEQPQPLDELDAQVVLAANEGLVGHGEIELLQRRLGEQPPESHLRVLLGVGERLGKVGGGELLAQVAKRLGLELEQHVLGRGLGLAHERVEGERAYLEVREGADVGRGDHRLLGNQLVEDVHAGLLHHGEELGLVLCPEHVPDVLALEARRRVARRCRRSGHLAAAALWLAEVEEGEDAVDVDDGKHRRVAVDVERESTPRAQVVDALDGDVGQGVAGELARVARDEQAGGGGGDGDDRVR
mmetsp:Transcript_33311/g.71162  ORF Transcript_33311/g.71162 Transcript_33311/m.71162 type:complete len:672 (+) Transcript_33311:101-2116(+)